MNTKTRTKMKSTKLEFDKDALKEIKFIAVAHSAVEREWFPTEEAFKAELEVIDRAQEVMDEVEKLGIKCKLYPADQYFLTNILVDRPDLVINLVDTVKGKDRLQTSVAASLELTDIVYTAAGMQGLVIGNDRYIFKQLLAAIEIPTPDFKFIRDLRTKVPEDFKPPIIVKLNESGGSVGIEVTQENITKAAGAELTINEHGTTIERLAQAVSLVAPNACFCYKYNSSFKDIEEVILKEGYPVGIKWQGLFEDREEDELPDGDYGHYSIISHIDIEKKEVIIVDPYKDFVHQDRIMPIDKFVKRWWDTNEIINTKSKKSEIVEDFHLFFIVVAKSEEFPLKLKMQRFKI